MANVPCTLLMKSNDKVLLPPEALFVVCKQIFRFGVKLVEMRGEQVVIKLAYTPKGDTMRRKLGNLPVQYIRLAVENEQELQLLKNVMQMFRFDFKADDEEELKMLNANLQQPPQPSIQQPEKRKRTNEDINVKKIKILEDIIIKPAADPSTTSSSSSSSFMETTNEDCQKKNVKAKKRGIKTKSTILPSTSSSTSSLIEVYDKDSDLFESQKYSILDV